MNEEVSLLKAIVAHPNEDTPRLMYADWIQEQGDEGRAQAIRHGVVKRFGVDFDSPGGALTLNESEVSEVSGANGPWSRTHRDGWTIRGDVHHDWYTWVNEFEASHPTHGLVWGDFESLVFASTVQAFRHFIEHHPPSAWDYHDI